MQWKPYDATWLVELAREQCPEEAWLPDALAACTHYMEESQAYYYFVDPTSANQPGSEWQFERNIILEDRKAGTLVLDILQGHKIGGVEFLKCL